MRACCLETVGSSTTISFCRSRPMVMIGLCREITFSARGPCKKRTAARGKGLGDVSNMSRLLLTNASIISDPGQTFRVLAWLLSHKIDREKSACQKKGDVLYSATERCQSGRMCRSRKAVGCKPSWVRIPLSPLSLEESHSGLVSTTGNRVRCKPPWVRIPPPPPHIPKPTSSPATNVCLFVIIGWLNMPGIFPGK